MSTRISKLRISAIVLAGTHVLMTSQGCGVARHSTAEEACVAASRQFIAYFECFGLDVPDDFDEEVFRPRCAAIPNTTECIDFYECVIDAFDCANLFRGAPESGCGGDDFELFECVIPSISPGIFSE